MDIFHAVILGVVEGLTEFLPVSSTFHLIFAGKILGLDSSDFVKLFEVVIQSGAVAAVISLFWRQVWNDNRLKLLILLSFIPTALIGFGLHRIIKDVFFEDTQLMIVVFAAVGVLFILVEVLIKMGVIRITRSLDDLGYVGAVLAGVAQAAAVVPGVSRAGAVIVFMMIMGFGRAEAATYSFLLAAPTIFAASALDLWQMRDALLASSDNLYLLLTGAVVAFITAYYVMKLFISFLQARSLIWFGLYRILVGLALFYFFIYTVK